MLSIDELYNKFGNRIYKYFIIRTNISDAEDLTSEVFAIATKNKNKLPEGNELAYLYKISNNIIKEYYKKNKKELELKKNLINFATVDTNIDLKPLLALTQEELELLYLQIIDELSTYEIAVILGISNYATRKRISRIKNKIKRSQK
jgi:RNA polymerase sigma factor (sigma-70 family)